MRRRLGLVIGLAVLLAAGYVVARVVVVPERAYRREFSVKIIRRWADPGLSKLVWAGGPAIIEGDGRRILSLDRDGEVRSVRRTDWQIISSHSIQCDDAVVIGGCADADETFAGLIDLRTGKHTKLASGSKACFYLNMLTYNAQFWSPDYQTFLAKPPIRTYPNDAERKAAKKQLVLVHLKPPSTSLWSPSNGGYPTSWVWSDDKGKKGFWVLASRPGGLYHLGATDEQKLTIPALDQAATTILSPTLDRAVAFRKPYSQEAYLVDFSKPESEQPIATEGSSTISDLVVGGGAWSPDGRQIALLLADRTNRRFELYVGDPALTLKKVNIKGLRFVNMAFLFWESMEEGGPPGSGSFVWSADSKSIYCRMPRLPKTGDKIHYVLVRVDVPT